MTAPTPKPLDLAAVRENGMVVGCLEGDPAPCDIRDLLSWISDARELLVRVQKRSLSRHDLEVIDALLRRIKS
jgi:hypothetical protein